MIVVPCEQGTPEWMAARVGIPTASNFSRILTPKKLERSRSSSKYINELVAERLLGASLDDGFLSEWVDRGKDLEEKAFAHYEWANDVDVERVGFVMHDKFKVGCSPDGLIRSRKRGLELKCPKPSTHVGYLLDGLTDEYRCQVQGSLWVTGLEWWDLMSFHPDLPPAILRVERDEKFMAAFDREIKTFCQSVDECEAKIRAKTEEAAA